MIVPEKVGKASSGPWRDVIGHRERLLLEGRDRTVNVTNRAALVMVDLFAQAFAPVENRLSCEPFSSAALPHLRSLLDGARAAGIPVVHTTGEDREESRPGAATLMLESRDRSAEALAAAYQIVRELQPVQGEPVVYKSAPSAFFETPMASILRRLDVRRLVVCGESTSGCVRASVVDAYSHGFEVVIAEEAVFDRSSVSHKINLFDMELKYGTVVPVGRILQEWRNLQSPSADRG